LIYKLIDLEKESESILTVLFAHPVLKPQALFFSFNPSLIKTSGGNNMITVNLFKNKIGIIPINNPLQLVISSQTISKLHNERGDELE
jgi:hypothetical protein